MSRDWESQFIEWAKPLGKTEEDRSENALSAIRNAINQSDKLKSRSVSVFCHGSYRNNTNVRKDSDIDVGVLCKNTFFYYLQPGQNAVSLGLTPATYPYSQFKNDVGDALTSYFGKGAVTRGNKAFDLHETSYHVDADVAPFFEYRYYLAYGGYHEGVALLTDNEQRRVENWPEQHYKNGVQKNEDTKRQYKKIVRVLKSLSNEMTGANIQAGNIPSFLIECLVWNVPNYLFQNSTYPAYNTGQIATPASTLLGRLVATPPRAPLSDFLKYTSMWSAETEWYAPWKSINGFDIEPNTISSMKVLIEGLFSKDRLLQYIHDFIVFEEANEKITKKGAKYHQFFAVRLAAEKTVETIKAGDEKRIGVIWHTTGSGKSLSMAFLVGILRHMTELENPSFVIQVDRNDLDDQLHDQFVVARSLVGDVKQADSVEDLRNLLKTEGGEVIFTTIEKFRLNKESGEIEHPILSPRPNIIIIADEAHRSQYGFIDGYARYLAEALPNARRIGFTGTPISFSGADTIEVFGDLIHTYDIRQSQEDGATKPIYYAPRQVKLHLSQADIDAALKDLTENANATDLERRKSRWAALAAAAGAKERVGELAKDLLQHFLDRSATLTGKALAVCMTRDNCVRLYDALTALPGCPEVKVVMTGNLSDDPPEWNKAGHLTTKAKRDIIKKRMIDPDDPLKIVIVCDMWLTGTDIPCLHTLYVDKPMQGHSMIQAISRVNRVFRDKPHGLIVDYIGIGDELREATAKYSQGGGRGEPAPNIEDTAKPLFFDCLSKVRETLPEGQSYGGWRRMSRIQMEDMYSLVYGALTDDDERCEQFLQAELRLTSTFILVKHLDDCRAFADEIIFCQRVRKQIKKLMPGGKKKEHELDKAVRDLVDDNVESEGVVDIFAAAGLEKADISIIDDRFLMTFKDKPHEDLRLKLLNKILDDAIRLHQRKNISKAKSFRKMLEETLQKYHNRLIDAAAVVKSMLEIKKEMEADETRAKELHLQADELAFYDAVAENYATIYDQQFLSDLIRDVVITIKKNLKVDWTEPHREDVKAAVRAAVKRVLRRRGVKEEDFEPFMIRIMQQAEALYGDNYWLMTAQQAA